MSLLLDFLFSVVAPITLYGVVGVIVSRRLNRKRRLLVGEWLLLIFAFGVGLVVVVAFFGFLFLIWHPMDPPPIDR
jgi:CHASE2 domain-containing sensor protein